MSPEEHYARAEELLADTVMVRGQLSHQGEWFEHLLARAQVHATLALFSPQVSINVQNPKSADELAERVVPNREHPYFVWEQGYQAAVTDSDAGVDGTRGNAYTSNPYALGESEPDPATEPAEERCQSVSIFRERCTLVPGHDGRHAGKGCVWGYPPAPVEPTETGPKTWCAITGADSNPGGEHAYVTVRVPKDFVSGQSMADLAGAGKSRELARLLIPFVAAEKEEA